jgi:hypothetical protein
MPIYGIDGRQGQYICREWEKPEGAIEMQGPPPTPNAVAQADGTWGYSSDAIRGERDRLLSACDFTQLPDAPLSAAQKAEWSDYRQALRDIPLQDGFPNSVVWPIAPEA